jgi:hypothetical protein
MPIRPHIFKSDVRGALVPDTDIASTRPRASSGQGQKKQIKRGGKWENVRPYNIPVRSEQLGRAESNSFARAICAVSAPASIKLLKN